MRAAIKRSSKPESCISLRTRIISLITIGSRENLALASPIASQVRSDKFTAKLLLSNTGTNVGPEINSGLNLEVFGKSSIDRFLVETTGLPNSSKVRTLFNKSRFTSPLRFE